MNNKNIYRFIKRFFDIVFSILGLIIFSWLILIAWLFSTFDTGANGFYRQVRVGKNGRLFKVNKIRTMSRSNSFTSTITQSSDPRITKIGSIIRRLKIDELPQLWNVFIGEMSFVGPRPDVQGYADRLEEEEKCIILSVRPGITGPATLKYRNEEYILSKVKDPIKYNNEVIYPDKVNLNIKYIDTLSFKSDLLYILKTILNILF